MSLKMDYMDDDTNSTTSSVDVFDEFDEWEYDRMEDIFMRDGLRQMPLLLHGLMKLFLTEVQNTVVH